MKDTTTILIMALLIMTILITLNTGDILTLLITDFTYLLIIVNIKSKCNVSFINVIRIVVLCSGFLSIVAVS